ncbi:MAG: hypothetical protein AAGD14_02775 [Planctomycetota bacterium]
MDTRPAWLTFAYRSGLSDHEKWARGHTSLLPAEPEARDVEAVAALDELGVHLLHRENPDFPTRLAYEDGPIVVQVAGNPELIDDEDVRFVPGSGKLGRQAIEEGLEAGDRMVLVPSKGMLKARTMLKALAERIEEGQVALLSAEPPLAAWGPVRDSHRDQLIHRLSESSN